MARPREPIALVQAKGKKHLTKAEIAAREASEVKPCTDDIAAPSYLTAAQKKTFTKLANQLQKINIMGETDVDALARYIAAQDFYEQATKDLRAHLKTGPSPKSETYHDDMNKWCIVEESLAKMQDRYFKQAHTCASALGLTISSRCKLEVPVAPEEPKRNKFSRFEVVAK